MAAASPEFASASVQTLNPSGTGESGDLTRVACYEFQPPHVGDPEGGTLTKVSEWTLEGPVEGVEFHQTGSGKGPITRVLPLPMSVY